jgi:hypothetical protein
LGFIKLIKELRMNEKTKTLAIKLTLTIPALIVGILSAVIMFCTLLLKPLVNLWFPEEVTPEAVPVPPEDSIENHTFM